MNATQAKYGAPKLEMYAAYYFFLKHHSYLCARKFILRVDNQALSWLKTYSTDQALIDRWIMALEKYHFKVEQRPRTQHRNADGLSKRTNDYRWLEKQLEKLPPVADKRIFFTRGIRLATCCTLVELAWSSDTQSTTASGSFAKH